MKLSSKTDCALRTVLDLAVHSNEGVIRTSVMAERLDISRDYMAQILNMLKVAGIVRSKRGLDGGYMLARNPEQLTVMSIVQLTDPALAALPEHPSSQNRTLERAVVADMWGRITERLNAELEAITIHDICDQVTAMANRDGTDYAI